MKVWQATALVAVLFPLAAWAQFKADGAGAPPAELKPAIAQLLEPAGYLITNAGAKYCEIWFRAKTPRGAPSKEPNVTLPEIPLGAVLGVIRIDGAATDRRGQKISPGLYLLRYGILPNNTSHEGAAPQRDFLLLTPAAVDTDPVAKLDPDPLVDLSRKASGTAHPAVLSFWKATSDAAGFSQQGEDWVLQAKIGDVPVDLIVEGVGGS
jgi:hypothetical protein